MPEEISELRRRAEEKNAQAQKNAEPLSPEEIQNVLLELRVHQIELEMQNEELRTSLVKLEAARTRYFDLYELAPATTLQSQRAAVVRPAHAEKRRNSILGSSGNHRCKGSGRYAKVPSRDKRHHRTQKGRGSDQGKGCAFFHPPQRRNGS